MDVDAVVVGARCAGATLATLLARAGWRVLMVDRDPLPSDTVSTHVLFPHTLHRLDALGALARLRAAHDIPALRYSWRVLGHEVAGGFTPVGGFDRNSCVRRSVLDRALLDTAVAAGVRVRSGRPVLDVIGTGTTADPVRGVVLDDGGAVTARWVFGADGRTSTIARRLGLRTGRRLRGEQSYLFAYWRGLPAADATRIDAHESLMLMSTPCEDDVHLLCLAGGPQLTRGTPAQRERRYAEGLRRFPATLNPRLLEHAERISSLIVVPETMLRGYFRQATGPGWALLGDAGHFKHPVTAQGIGDAVEHAHYVAEAVTTRGTLAEYQQWRDDRAGEHYEWSYRLAEAGASTNAEAVYAGLAADPAAAQQWRDIFTTRLRPSAVHTPERMHRWLAASAYQDGRRRVSTLIAELDERQLRTPVPSCPAWTVRDLLAHLVGVAADTASGDGFFPGAPAAWHRPDLAAARERWTAGQVDARRSHDVAALLREWDKHGSDLETALRRGDGFTSNAPDWMLSAPAADLGVHLFDLYEALGCPGDADAPVVRLGRRVYQQWLGQRLSAVGLPALRLDDGRTAAVLGSGEPAISLRGEPLELFRTLTGRRSAAQIRAMDWDADPSPYLDVISPYPLRTLP
ncbi:FAD-dependent monooxygenase [Dactylosporangium sp. AC04546]|uniref:FAD-dependent monooxygenase n=1 Tax=Dactylosporangium sp. AC04546 TaxID=2862460 RepID=UPI001EDDBBDB|nr:FAD-dependent monooxygenase [Dactylosporangium sp. AC04546]WVK86366.1 FAD-dependent monooxygenase [Dactylosporangium sp. AC04546]